MNVIMTRKCQYVKIFSQLRDVMKDDDERTCIEGAGTKTAMKNAKATMTEP